MPPQGQEQAINTLKATSCRKKGRIIHCLPTCRTETGARRKLRWRQAAGPRGVQPCLCQGGSWAVSGDSGFWAAAQSGISSGLPRAAPRGTLQRPPAHCTAASLLSRKGSSWSVESTPWPLGAETDWWPSNSLSSSCPYLSSL